MFQKHYKYDKRFEKRLKKAARREMTPEEMKEQRVSFAMGMLPADSPITKDEMRKLLDKPFL